jgi:hypothetical protein
VKSVAFIFLCLIVFFTMEPLMSSQGMFGPDGLIVAGVKADAKTVPGEGGMRCCHKMAKCPKQPSPTGNGRKCQGNGCNPFMACAYGNFYLVETTGVAFVLAVQQKDKKIPINDNRLSSSLSDSWHPPEFFVEHLS